MRIISNEKLIRRNARLGQVGSIGGLIILGGGMFISFRYPEQVGLAWLALLVGFALSQAGLYYGNRWGRRPRPDEHLNTALKSLNDSYTIYHYATAVHHLLLGPTGVWVLMPRHQTGKIVFEKNRWRQKGGGLFQGYLRIFAQEGIGRPDLEVGADLESIQKYLKKQMPDMEFPEPKAALVFTSEKAVLENLEEAPIPTVEAKKLKELVRKAGKEKLFSPEELKEIQAALEK